MKEYGLMKLTIAACFAEAARSCISERLKTKSEDSNLRPRGPESGESRLLTREETRRFLMVSIEPFAAQPYLLVEVC